MAWTRRSALALAGITLAAALGIGVRALAASDEQTMTSMVAATRLASGVGALRSDASLAAIARVHSKRMRDAGKIFHNDHIASNMDDMAWLVVGENVGRGPSLEPIQDALMRSSAHRHNILDARFNAIGVGIATARNGELFVTQVFAQLVAARSAPLVATPKAPPPKAAPLPGATLSSLVAHSPDASVRAEDGSLVPASFFARWCARVLTSEDGTKVPASYYDDCDGGRAA